MRPDALLLTEGGNVKLAPVLGVAERQLPMLTRMHEHEREAREREAEKAAHVAVLEQHRVHVAEAATRAAAARAHLHEVYGGEDNVSETTAPAKKNRPNGPARDFGTSSGSGAAHHQPAPPPGCAPSHELTPFERAKKAAREHAQCVEDHATMVAEAAAHAEAAERAAHPPPTAAQHPFRTLLGCPLPAAHARAVVAVAGDDGDAESDCGKGDGADDTGSATAPRQRRDVLAQPQWRGGPRTHELAYLSPESLSGVGTVDTSDDMWALGCVLVELMTGVLSEERGTTGLLGHPEETAAGLPRELAKEVARSDKTLGLLAKELLRVEREKRPTAQEVQDRLARDGAKDDRRALCDLYHATGGEAWVKSYNWCNEEKDIALWYGVTALDGRVVKIDLGGNNLRGELPPSLGMCAQLRSLILWGNALRGTLPDSLVNCVNLEELNVAHNALSGRLPKWLGELSVFESLWADNNRLEGPIPPSLGQLRDLGILQLKHNRIEGSIPPQLGACHSLRVLSLASNKLSGCVPDALGHGLTRLQKLALGDNRLVGPIPDSLGRLTSLKSLSLRLNQLTGPIPVALCGATALSKLALDGNMLSGPAMPPALCESLVELRELHLQQNSALSGEVPHAVAHLEHLVELKCYSTCLEGALPDELCRCTALKELKLRDNRLCGRLPVAIGALKELQLLSLGGNYLDGEIPASLAQCVQLEGISLSHNRLGGRVNQYREQWFGKLTKLSVVELAFNEPMHGSGNEFTQEQFEERFPGVKVVL